jgi:hypothetical protein
MLHSPFLNFLLFLVHCSSLIDVVFVLHLTQYDIYISQHLELCTGHAAWLESFIHSKRGFKLKAGEEKGISQFLLFICDVNIETCFQALRAGTMHANTKTSL